MDVLILNKWGLTSLPFHEWFGPSARLFMITTAEAAASVAPGVLEAMCVETHVVEDYDRSPAVEQLARQISARTTLRRIVAMSESDLVRAARLREFLGVDTNGQSVASAIAYRDKVEMKRQLSAGGIPVAGFRTVDNYTDLVSAGASLGFPLVLKPRRGASSVGVDVILDATDLDRVGARRLMATHDAPAGLVAEEYVEHELFHVDGLWQNGHFSLLWPSRMTNTLGFNSGEILRSATLDPGDPLVEDLLGLVERTVKVLPTPDVTVVHAEIFRSMSTGALLVNEIASRLGGGRIKASIKLSHHEDLVESYVRALADSDGRAGAIPKRRIPERAAGFLLIPPRAGVVVSVPQAPIPSDIDEVRVTVEPGTPVVAAATSVDAMASVTVVGHSADHVLDALDRAAAWVEAGLVVR